ncbi:unnamed protein product, partial [Staurois parvus]
LSCAQQFIHVDEKHIQDALHWLESVQSPNGCFQNSDSYFYNDIFNDDITRTAFILISLMEHRIVYDGSLVENAKAYLRKEAENAKTPHVLAVLAYAFTLLGDNELRALMLKTSE